MPSKLRVWDKNKFQYVNLTDAFNWLNYGDTFESSEDRILQQFTGLQDKNGKEIYEGDIIKHENFQCIVGWYEELAGFGPFCEWDEYERSHNYDPKESEVIGNIYQNPELH